MYLNIYIKLGGRGVSKLFVYGTLRQHPRNPLTDRTLARTRGRLYHLGNFPGMLESEDPQDQVIGELVEVSNNRLVDLDLYEGYIPYNLESSLYIRKEVEVFNENTQQIEMAWTYIFNQTNPWREHWVRIESGDWFKPNENSA